jgi:hypothetical protein
MEGISEVSWLIRFVKHAILVDFLYFLYVFATVTMKNAVFCKVTPCDNITTDVSKECS